ncbi:hypothetical protein GCM10023210_22690 [Chryseobacterium ginsengisoli]|uniref:HTH cro/C1-type domain-containing protein n=2 Tax=Chryseobacterium ginsengisoli TaxID=363853 RepID=A0ABP9M9Y0_9FLAO
MMSIKKKQKKNMSSFPHIGEWVKKIIADKKLTQAEVARKMQITPTSLANYFKQPSLQFRILWDLGLALEYDFLTELINYYPPSFALNENSEIVRELKEKTQLLLDLQKEMEIYKAALGVKK